MEGLLSFLLAGFSVFVFGLLRVPEHSRLHRQTDLSIQLPVHTRSFARLLLSRFNLPFFSLSVAGVEVAAVPAGVQRSLRGHRF